MLTVLLVLIGIVSVVFLAGCAVWGLIMAIYGIGATLWGIIEDILDK